MVLVLLFLWGPLPLGAEPLLPPHPPEAGAGSDFPEEMPTEEPAEEPGLIDAAHELVSESILSSARWIDAFFSDERVVREETETRFRLGVSNFTRRGELFRTDLRTSFRLDLPLSTERLRFLLSREEDGEDRALFSSDRIVRRPALTQREREASVSLRYFLLSTLRRNASISTGLRFRNGSPVFQVEPRYRQTFPIRAWDLRFTQRFAAYTDDRLEIHTSFDLERPLDGEFFFRTTLAGTWLDHEENYAYGLYLAFFQPLGPDRMIQYLWATRLVTRPDHVLEESGVSVAYRQRIWRDWLFFELTPQVSFPREKNYEISPALLLRVDIIFGAFETFGVGDM